jgi:hypothetical protein
LRVVSEWATRRRRAERVSDQQLQKVPSARKIARLRTTARDLDDPDAFVWFRLNHGENAVGADST